MKTIEIKLKTFTEGVENSDKEMKQGSEQFNPLKTTNWFVK
jgi:hypothetical protein